MKALFPLLAALALPLGAHVMSMSTGDVTVQGNRAHYELSMPIYEIGELKNPETALFDHVHFSTAGQPGRLVRRACHPDMGQGAYLCSADYEFPVAVDRLDIECTFYQITVPNHVHLLRAARKTARTVRRSSTLQPRPPRFVSILLQRRKPFSPRPTQRGFVRALGGLAQILFASATPGAGRAHTPPCVLLALTGMFLLGQIAAALIAPGLNWSPAPRFVEAATALTIAYMAVEILVLPEAGKRWLIAGVLGIFHGLYFALFLSTSEFHALYVLSGAALAEAILIVFFAFCFSRIGKLAAGFRPAQVSASLLLAVGMFWFFLRLRS